MENEEFSFLIAWKAVLSCIRALVGRRMAESTVPRVTESKQQLDYLLVLFFNATE